jgi:hypothetical protein
MHGFVVRQIIHNVIKQGINFSISELKVISAIKGMRNKKPILIFFMKNDLGNYLKDNIT